MDRTRELGQYFTPRAVVELCYNMLRALDPHTRDPRVIDPASGDGAFLAYALDHRFASPDRLYGIEKDPGVISGDHQPHGIHLFTRDALIPSSDYPDSSFDWVVGNPPFGTRSMPDGPELAELARMVEERYTVWRTSPFGVAESCIRPEKLAKYPIEILFLERFLQLARPGGYVAVIVPDGLLANARLSYVREWLMARAHIKMIISLPQHMFWRNGAWSKVSVLVFCKAEKAVFSFAERLVLQRDIGAGSETHPAPIFMAALESRERVEHGIGSLIKIFAAQSEIRNPQSEIACPPWQVHAVDDLVPGDRLDPAYHHPKYAENLRFLEALPNIVRLGDLIEFTTYGQVGRREFTDSGVRFITPANLATTRDGLVAGIDIHSPERFVSPGSHNDPVRSRLRKGDLLLVNSGVGCIGRVAVFMSDEPCNISQHINLVRVKDIEPEYLAVYLQTKCARLQIAREKCGVGACGINFDRIRSILVPILPEQERKKIAREYRRLSSDPVNAASLVSRLVQRLEKLIGRPPT